MGNRSTISSELKMLETRLRETLEQFLQLVEDIRPQLHKYCARMTRSALDGEDLVRSVVRVEWQDGLVNSVRDYRYVSYLLQDAEVEMEEDEKVV